jgi:hypothetical protein
MVKTSVMVKSLILLKEIKMQSLNFELIKKEYFDIILSNLKKRTKFIEIKKMELDLDAYCFRIDSNMDFLDKIFAYVDHHQNNYYVRRYLKESL